VQDRNYKFEPLECTHLFKVFIEVVADPKIVDERAFPAWDDGDLGHKWRITACTQEQPSK
jgi:hypothetical protein